MAKQPGLIDQLLSIAEEKLELNKGRIDAKDLLQFRSRLGDSIHRFQQEQDDTFGSMINRKGEILDCLRRALAFHVVAHWDHTDMQEYLGFDGDPTSVDQVAEWLDRDWESIKGCSDYRDDWFEKSLMLLIDHSENELWGWLGHQEHAWNEHWSQYDSSEFPEKTRSNQPGPIQRFVFDLCRLWEQYVDPNVGLPPRSGNNTNPLLRFVDLALLATIGDDRPEPKRVHTFIADHARKILRDARESGEYPFASRDRPNDPFPNRARASGN